MAHEVTARGGDTGSIGQDTGGTSLPMSPGSARDGLAATAWEQHREPSVAYVQRTSTACRPMLGGSPRAVRKGPLPLLLPVHHPHGGPETQAFPTSQASQRHVFAERVLCVSVLSFRVTPSSLPLFGSKQLHWGCKAPSCFCPELSVPRSACVLRAASVFTRP